MTDLVTDGNLRIESGKWDGNIAMSRKLRKKIPPPETHPIDKKQK